MATSTPANGSYLQHADPQNFPANPTGAPPPNYQNQNPTTSQPTTGNEVPKDEVGWYFVEQYYTTLNKTPDRLHLFYNKKSSFVWGTEGESLPLAHGRLEIQEKIAGHEFKDCKVRVSNVDSQASAGNGIVIQVLGEMSNNGLPNRKFSQTFFLAEQPNGYYVLNDIFRYLKDDDDIEEGDEYEYPEEVADAVEEIVEEIAEEIVEQIQDVTTRETSTVEVDQDEGETVSVEETHTIQPEIPELAAEETPVNGTPEPVNGTSAPPSEPEEPLEEVPKVEAPVEEKPAPVPPVEEKIVAAPKEPVVPAVPVPVLPKTWASLVARKPAGATPVSVPVTATPVVPVSVTSTPAAVTATAPPKQSAPTTAAPATPSGGSQWVVADNGKRHNRVNANTSVTASQTLAYVKNVTENVKDADLKNVLLKYGAVKSFEINRQKNCAFVEFDTPGGFAAANAANPHILGGSNVYVEAKFIHSGGRPYNNRGGMTGGRGNQNQGGRGNYAPRGDGQRGRGRPGGQGNYNNGGGRGGFRTGTPTN